MDKYVESQDEVRIAVTTFREQTREFYRNAKTMGLPFSRRVFVATVCSAYEYLVTGRKLNALRIKVATMQKIWRDYSVKTLVAYWREADMVIRAAWPDADLSKSHLVKWPNFIDRYFSNFEKECANDFSAEVDYQVVFNTDLIKKPHMEGFANLIFAIELI